MRLSNFLTTSGNERIAADQANYDIVVCNYYVFTHYKNQIPSFMWNNVYILTVCGQDLMCEVIANSAKNT